jgi:hypothetical protein
MRFQVPQFIEIEDTIFGPLTFKQFLYLAGGGGLCFIAYVYLPIYISVFFIAIIAGLAVALAFYKYNGRNFIFIFESFVKYLVSKKLYLWKQKTNEQKIQAPTKVISKAEGIAIPKLSKSKLEDLSWSLDIQNSPIEENDNES